MSEQNIAGLDVEEEGWQAWSPPSTQKLRKLGAVAILRHAAGPTSEETLRALSAEDCARLSLFLADAADPRPKDIDALLDEADACPTNPVGPVGGSLVRRLADALRIERAKVMALEAQISKVGGKDGAT